MKSPNQIIALFGTSADPPTIGHKLILEELSKIYSSVITYASDNPSKEHKESLFFRSLLLRTLIRELSKPEITLNQELSTPYAIETIRKAKKIYKCSNIDFVIGSDLLEEIFHWKNIKEILEEAKLFVIPRKDYPIQSKNFKKIKAFEGNYQIAQFEIPKISSTMIREETEHKFLPKSLIPIVKNNNLYKSHRM